MILRLALTLGIAFSLAAAIPQTARADAGEFLGGAVVGGIVGYAIGKDQQKKNLREQLHRTAPIGQVFHRPRKARKLRPRSITSGTMQDGSMVRSVAAPGPQSNAIRPRWVIL